MLGFILQQTPNGLGPSAGCPGLAPSGGGVLASSVSSALSPSPSLKVIELRMVGT